MDTSKHVALVGSVLYGPYIPASKPDANSNDAKAVRVLKDAGLLCTKAEREYLDTLFEHFDGDEDASEVTAAYTAVIAERRAAEQVRVNAEANAKLDAITNELEDMAQAAVEQDIRTLLVRIASLEAALAEERAKPKEGAVRFVAEQGGGADDWLVFKQPLEWGRGSLLLRLRGDAADSLAREHAARLQAEHDAKGGAA